MIQVNLHRFPKIGRQSAVKELNLLVKGNRRLMLHQIAVAANCEISEAMGLILLLFYETKSEIYILVYHTSDIDDPPVLIDRRLFREGLPSLPFICSNCGQEIVSSKELSFDVSVEVAPDITFVSEPVYAQR